MEYSPIGRNKSIIIKSQLIALITKYENGDITIDQFISSLKHLFKL